MERHAHWLLLLCLILQIGVGAARSSAQVRPNFHEMVELNANNWRWYVENGDGDKHWFVLFYSRDKAAHAKVYEEWLKAHKTLSPYIRMGSIDSSRQTVLMYRLSLHYRLGALLVEPGSDKFRYYGGQMTAEAFIRYISGLFKNKFVPVWSLREFTRVASRREGGWFWSEAAARVKVFLLTDEKFVPLSWKYVSNQPNYDLISWYHIDRSRAPDNLIQRLRDQYGIDDETSAILLPDAENHTKCHLYEIRLDEATDEESQLDRLEDWITQRRIPFFHHLRPSQFLENLLPCDRVFLVLLDPERNDRLVTTVREKLSVASSMWETSGDGGRVPIFLWAEYIDSVTRGFGADVKSGSLVALDRKAFRYSVAPQTINRMSPEMLLEFVKDANLSKRRHQKPMKALPKDTTVSILSTLLKNWQKALVALTGFVSFLLYRLQQ